MDGDLIEQEVKVCYERDKSFKSIGLLKGGLGGVNVVVQGTICEKGSAASKEKDA